MTWISLQQFLLIPLNFLSLTVTFEEGKQLERRRNKKAIFKIQSWNLSTRTSCSLASTFQPLCLSFLCNGPETHKWQNKDQNSSANKFLDFALAKQEAASGFGSLPPSFSYRVTQDLTTFSALLCVFLQGLLGSSPWQRESVNRGSSQILPFNSGTENYKGRKKKQSPAGKKQGVWWHDYKHQSNDISLYC